MTDDHHIVPLLVQPPPRLVRNGNVPQGLSAFKGEGWEDEDLLGDLNKWRHFSASETSECAGEQPNNGKRKRGEIVGIEDEVSISKTSEGGVITRGGSCA